MAAGPLKGALKIVRSYSWQVSTDSQGRSSDRRSVDVTTSVELRVGEPFARVRLAFDNPCADHRVRYHIPLPAPVASSFAEGQFAVVERGLEVEGVASTLFPLCPRSGWSRSMVSRCCSVTSLNTSLSMGGPSSR